MNINSIKTTLLAKFRKPKNRHAFANKYLGSHIAAQMRALRMSRGLSQEKMSEVSGIHQPRISAMESPTYEKYTLSTLKEIAEFFDVVPFFEFISFKELLIRIQSETPQDLAPPHFEQCFGQGDVNILPLPDISEKPELEPTGLDGMLLLKNNSPLEEVPRKKSLTFEDLLAEAGR